MKKHVEGEKIYFYAFFDSAFKWRRGVSLTPFHVPPGVDVAVPRWAPEPV